MGDRCYFQISCRKSDAGKVKEVFEYDDNDIIDEDGTAVTFEEMEANYGNDGKISDERLKGVPFHGFHDEGGSYGAGEFASDGETLTTAPTYKECGQIVSLYGGEFDESELERALRHRRNMEAAEALVSGRPRPEHGKPIVNAAKAAKAVMDIHDILHLAEDGSLDPDKEWDSGTTAAIADIIYALIPRPEAA